MSYIGELQFRFKLSSFDKGSFLNSIVKGIIDEDDTSKLILVDSNEIQYIHKKNKFQIYKIGDKIGQILFNQGENVEFIKVDKLESYDTRGTGGFGSTDLK